MWSAEPPQNSQSDSRTAIYGGREAGLDAGATVACCGEAFSVQSPALLYVISPGVAETRVIHEVTATNLVTC